MSLTILYSWFEQKLRLIRRKLFFTDKQRPLSVIRTNVLQKLRPTKFLFHALPHCKAKSTQNDSTSVEHNSKTLAQSKFNTRPEFYFLSKRHFSLYASLSFRLSFVVVVRFLFFVSVLQSSEHI